MKTSDLIGPALDWAVAKCYGYDEGWLLRQLTNPDPNTRAIQKYSTDWAVGGPLIERELIGIERCIHACEYHGWRALKDHPFDASIPEETTWGETPLVAAMRCYVASKLGDEVEIPEALK